MIREKRSKDKLEQYYQMFIKEGKLDPNIHPWVADSWQKSLEYGVPHETMPVLPKLSKEELLERQRQNHDAISFLNELYQEIHEHFTTYDLCLLLLDSECYTLKSYALPFFQKTPGETVGTRLTEEDIGTSSISIAYTHKTPFLLFGPEMWIKECQLGDACSAPVLVDGETKYILTLVSSKPESLPYGSVVSLMLSMKYAMEKHLKLSAQLLARQAILDAVPLAVYQIMPGGKVVYTNQLGENRLKAAGAVQANPNLGDVILNYQHTPIVKGFMGVPSYNKEVTWITANKTYEDITTVVPLSDHNQDVHSVLAVSLPIEDLRTMIAHAVGYTARYNLASLVGEDPGFMAMKEKAGRIAKSKNPVLLQGEHGLGKQRLAHGIHNASPRAGGPLITLKCGDLPQELLDNELFGILISEDESRTGKLELANGGTLFLDEIEKLPLYAAEKLAQSLKTGSLVRNGDTVSRPFDVRLIAACDSDLKRLTEKGAFSQVLYEEIGKSILRVMPLRSRRKDIPLLADHIISEIAEQHHLPTKSISPEAAEVLMSYEWPENVKQLQGVVEHAFFNTVDSSITPADLILPGNKEIAGTAWKDNRDIFMEAWRASGGNISRLANMLDVSRVTLYRYLKKFGMDKES